MREGGILHIHEVVPVALNGTDLVITAEPVEAVQVEAGGGVDVIGRKGGAAAAVEQHQ